MRSFAALMELAEILIPSVTMIKPIAANAAAARPPDDPDAIHKLIMSIGFHRTWPYALWAAAAVNIPSRPTSAVVVTVSRRNVAGSVFVGSED